MKRLNLTYWFLLFGFLLIIILLVFLTNNHKKKTSYTTEKKKQTQALIRQIARWTVASQQDTSPMIALLHANYAAGYLQALELITTEQEINQFSSLQELRKQVYQTQDKAARQVVASCPNYLGKNIDKELALMGIGV